jgi:hypothetical protein
VTAVVPDFADDDLPDSSQELWGGGTWAIAALAAGVKR